MLFIVHLISLESSEKLVCITYFSRLGKGLLDAYISSLYSKYIKSVGKHSYKMRLSEWKKHNQKLFRGMETSSIYTGIGGLFTGILGSGKINILEMLVISDEDYERRTDQVAIIVFENTFRKMLITNTKVSTVPTHLPMVVLPIPYKLINGVIKVGGYLNNDIKFFLDLFIDKVGYDHPTELHKNNLFIDLINGVSSVPYKINNEVLQYIIINGISKYIVLDYQDEELKQYNLYPYNKDIPKNISKDIKAKLSKIQLEQYIIDIAIAYSNVPKFYFPVRLDQRTRFYCASDFSNYQSYELTKGLLL